MKAQKLIHSFGIHIKNIILLFYEMILLFVVDPFPVSLQIHLCPSPLRPGSWEVDLSGLQVSSAHQEAQAGE